MRPSGTVLRNHLTRLCFTKGLTDAELATRAGVSRAQLNRIRNGRVVPRVDTAIALAAALGRRVRDVFYLTEPGPRSPA